MIETSFEHGGATLIVDPDGVLHALRWLRDTDGQGYRFLSSLHAADYLPGHAPLRRPLRAALPGAGGADPRQGAARRSGGRRRIERRRWRSTTLPELDSCVELFPTAEFQEREAYDFFGIVFRGHPDLRRILMPEDYVGWPQRRDFPIGGEPVLFTHNEIESPALVRVMADELLRDEADVTERGVDRETGGPLGAAGGRPAEIAEPSSRGRASSPSRRS